MSKNIQRAVSLVLLFVMLFAQCPVLSVQAEQEEAAPDFVLLSEETQESVEETEDFQESEGVQETENVQETGETTAQTEVETTVPETEATEQTEGTWEQEILLLEEGTEPPNEEAPEQDEEEFLLPMEIPDDSVAPVAEFGGMTLFSDGTPVLPEKYDSRDYGVITSVKNQGKYGLCWAFSAMAVGESSLISQDLAGTTIDLSERHLAYFCMGDVNDPKKTFDPLENAVEDSTVLTGNYLTAGSNNKYTTFALANWIGAADEGDYPYLDDPSVHDASAAVDDVAHLTDAYWINARDDKDNMKAYIQRNGAVGLSLYYSSSSSYLRRVSGQTGEYASYNGDYVYYNYNPEKSGTNHAITVVGWDDNYPAELFAKTPPSDGAWLCKNSYGTSSGNGGYFWLSYEDVAINTDNATAFVFVFGEPTEYDRNYHYDGSNGVSAMVLSNGESVANVFTAKGPGEEEIRAVGVGLFSADVDYRVQIYTGLEDPACPTSGTAAFDVPQEGRTNLCGYYTIALDTPVKVTAGETFAVVITLEKSDADSVSVFVDRSYDNSWIRFVANTEPDQSFLCRGSQNWSDLHGSGLTARVKAYTVVTNPVAVSGMHFDMDTVELVNGDTYYQEPVLEPEGAAQCYLSWSSSAAAVASVNSSGTVTAHKPGEAVIKARVRNTNIVASYTVQVKPPVESVKILNRKLEMLPGETYTPRAEIRPAAAVPYYTLAISSSDETVAIVEKGAIRALSPGTTVIHVSAGTASDAYMMAVQKPLYDAEISVEAANFVGKPLTPAVTVTLNGETLKKDKDYTLKYRNNTKPGTGTVTVTGMGAYGGTITKEYPVQIQVPDLLSVKNEASGIRVTWDAVSGASGYELYRCTNSGAWKRIATVSGSANTSYLDRSGLYSGTKYDYRICTRVSATGGTYLSGSSSTLALYRLTAPALSPIKQVQTGFQLTWKSVPGATAYHVMRSDNGAPANPVSYVPAAKYPSFVDETAVERDVLYTYSIVAEMGVGENSSLSAASTSLTACLPSTVGLNTILNDAKGIALNWSRSPGATGYVVYRSTDGVRWSKAATISEGTTLSWTDTRSTSGVRYHYRVQSTAKLGGTTYQSEISQPLSLYRLTTPKIQRITKAANGFVISWGNVAGADAYRIERRNDQGDPAVAQVVEASRYPQFTDVFEVQAGVVYQYYVTALRAEDASMEAIPGLACIPGTPTLLSAENTAKGIELRWEAAAAANGYVVYRSTDSVRWSKVATISGETTLSWTDTRCTSRVRYHYRVQSTAKLGGTTYQSETSQPLSLYRLTTPKIQRITKAANGFVISWGNVAGADAYRIERRNNQGDPAVAKVVEASRYPQFTDVFEVQAGVVYQYYVTALRGTDASMEALPGLACIPGAPTLLSAENTAKGIELRWEAAAAANGYVVYRSTDSVRWSKVATISRETTLSWTDTRCTSGVRYHYRVQSTAKLGGTTYQSETSQVLDRYRLTRPVINKTIAAKDGGFDVYWKRVTGADRYFLMRSEDDGPSTLVGTIEGGRVLHYLDATASACGKKYTYTVIAGRAYSERTDQSCESAGKTVCRLAAPSLDSVEVSGKNAIVQWKPVDLASGYLVYRSSDGRRWSLRKTITASNLLTWTDTYRTATSKYYYRIVATTKMDRVNYMSDPSNVIRN